MKIFKDYPDFKPNLTPREIFELGSFGGTYWRPIYSSITKKKYKNVHHKYPTSWWKGIPETHLSLDSSHTHQYDEVMPQSCESNNRHPGSS